MNSERKLRPIQTKRPHKYMTTSAKQRNTGKKTPENLINVINYVKQGTGELSEVM